MKNLLIALAIFILPGISVAQDISGVYVGKLTNDSNTARNDQSFELALSEYRGKITGYSYSSFIVADTFYYIVKRIKGTITGNVCEIKDDEIIACNYWDRIAKGVHQSIFLERNLIDSTWQLSGKWKTTATKKHGYYAVSGNVEVKADAELEQTAIIAHLSDLNLAGDLPYYQDSRIAQYQDAAPAVYTSSKKEDPVKTEEPKPDARAVAREEKAAKKAEEKEQKDNARREAIEKLAREDQQKKEAAQKATADKLALEERRKKEAAEKAEEQKASAAASAKIKEESVNRTTVTPAVTVSVAAAHLRERTNEVSNEIFVKSDSLRIALYDNGEVDGDTVSVILDGDMLMAKQGLRSSAIKSVIYFNDKSEMHLILYAENLGKYPPNTGLITVYDGEERIQVRFSADYERNTEIVFRRKTIN